MDVRRTYIWIGIDVIAVFSLIVLSVFMTVDETTSKTYPFERDDATILQACVDEMVTATNTVLLREALVGPWPAPEQEMIRQVGGWFKAPLRTALSQIASATREDSAIGGIRLVRDSDIPVDECRPWRKPPRLRLSAIGYDLNNGTAVVVAGFEPIEKASIHALLFEANEGVWSLVRTRKVFRYEYPPQP